MDDKVKRFIIETTEVLEDLERSLIVLEGDSSRTHLIKEVFSKIHTIKGTCGFLELARLETIFHHMESLLESMQKGGGILSSGVSIVLDALVYSKKIMKGLESQGQEPDGNDDDIIRRLQERYQEQEIGQQASGENNEIQSKEMLFEKESALNNHSLRIDVAILDKIINMVGELVLTRNELLERIRDDWDSPYLSAIQKLDFVTSNLQNESLKTRMQPISNVWDKLPGIVRDGCKKQNKKIAIQMTGQGTDVDRQVLQSIHDPFIHIIRNAIDHGIEPPAERLAAKKPEEGRISLKAFHEGGHIVLEVKDDGAGIDFDRVKKKAVDMNLVNSQDVNQLSEQELIGFLFKEGFTTSEEVSNISGRGMGMNIVISEIDKIGGSVDVFSKTGEGTTIRIKIPLTLAILSALTFKVNDQSFAISQTSVCELVRIDKNNRGQLGNVQKVKILHLRDTYLPLVNLGEALGMKQKYYYSSEEDFFIVVVQVGDTRFGIMVDDVQNTQEIAVKPCGSVIEKIGLYSGATILGDGQVILIIDPEGILKKAQLAGMSKLLETYKPQDDAGKNVIKDEGALSEEETTSFLVFRGSDNHPQTVQLSLIARLEEVGRERIQKRVQGYTMEYRNSLLPLIPFDENTLNGNEIYPIIVFSDGKRQMGLIVKSIDDVVEGALHIQPIGGNRDGILGAAMMNKQAMEVINLNYFLKQAFPDWFELERSDLKKNRETRILIVDDAQFFRELIKPALEAKGFIVRSAASGEQALKVLQTGFLPDLVISDLVMPDLDGFDLAVQIRRNSDWKNARLIALTSLMDNADREKAMKAGFDKYLIKYNQEELLGAIKEAVEVKEKR